MACAWLAARAKGTSSYRSTRGFLECPLLSPDLVSGLLRSGLAALFQGVLVRCQCRIGSHRVQSYRPSYPFGFMASLDPVAINSSKLTNFELDLKSTFVSPIDLLKKDCVLLTTAVTSRSPSDSRIPGLAEPGGS